MHHSWLRIAHRGASGSVPEHTRAAFERAVEIGVDMIELDVQLSRDQQLVVMHDYELERTTDGHGRVREHDWSDLRRLDAGSWFGAPFAGERLLVLDEVVEIVGTRARLNVELKSPPDDSETVAQRLLPLLERSGLIESTIISSFDPGALAAIRESSGDAKLGVLWYLPEFDPAWQLAQRLGAVSFHPYSEVVTEACVLQARERGIQTFAWTVNDVSAMRKLLKQGVDGIMTDFPELFADVDGDAAGVDS